MFHRSIYLDSLAGWACGFLGVLLALGDCFGITPDDSGFAGIVFLAAAHYIGVRRAMDEMEQREREAFELGRETGLRTFPRRD